MTTPSFIIDTVAAGNLPNVSFIDPAFDTEGNGTSADDHPLADIRLGERFIADAYHALASAGYLDKTVFIVTVRRVGRLRPRVAKPQVIDDTDPANVDHTGDETTPTDGQLTPDYKQLGMRVPAIVVSNLAPARVVHQGPFDHTSSLKLIESTFGLQALTARDANAQNLGDVLERQAHHHRRRRRDPDQQRGPRTDQRRRRRLQRHQRSVRRAGAGALRQVADRPPRVSAVRLADRLRNGRLRPQKLEVASANSVARACRSK